MSIPSDPEDLADYCRILEAQGIDTAQMSDGHVLVAVALNESPEMAAWFERRPVRLRAARISVELQLEAVARKGVQHVAMDLKLRDEVGLDVRLLEVFDDEQS